ncbi:MAG: transcription antitermination factor NusB [bacterium]
MGRRRLGRETAFKALYRIDLTGKGIEEAMRDLDPDGDPEAQRFAQELLETVGANRTRLDEVLDAACDRFGLSRMGVVDRSILRLGCAEILYWRWIPGRVSIDEYVEIAKKYSTEEGAGLVNAVLDRIARQERPEEVGA